MNKRRPIRFNPDHSDLARKFCMLGATDDETSDDMRDAHRGVTDRQKS